MANFAAGCILVVSSTLVYRISGGRYRRWLAVAAGAGVMAVSTLTPFNL